MCGLVASPVLDTAVALATALKTRGTRAWSLSVVDLDTYTIEYNRASSSPFDATVVEEPELQTKNPFYIFHLQSPTAEKYRFHPAVHSVNNTDHHLWHNGMMDSSEHAKYDRNWDTQLLLELLVDDEGNPHFEHLSDFQGSFACYYLNVGVGLYVFRNRISPQYYDAALNTYASIKREESVSIEPNIVYNMLDYTSVATFENTYNPFGV